MDYVIFDLEWNQCPYGKEKENPKLPFEIIEIGAVKMDGERNVVGTFHRIVKPVVYQHLHHRTREVVGLTEEDLQNGIPFAQAVQEFLHSPAVRACSAPVIGDLTELQRNMKFYNLLSLIREVDSFLRCTETVRDPVRNDEEPPGARVRRRLPPPSPEGRAFHQALSDAKYTADILHASIWMLCWRTT